MAVLHCRSCDAPLSSAFVDLGLTPISNAFVPVEQASSLERFYPLKCMVCDVCRLVQLADFETPDVHFHGDYIYFSSYSSSWLDHARRFVDMATERFRLGPDSNVVEVASNDGYLLQYFVKKSIPCFGVDPAANCAAVAKAERSVETEVAFFGRDTATRLLGEGRAVDLLVANNVLAHVPDLNDFIAGIKILLKPSGTASIEFPHLLQLIANNQFDTIYHEHYYYFSQQALKPLFARHGLVIDDVERLPTHGGSLRLFVRHAFTDGKPRGAVTALEADERAAGLDRAAAYADFGKKVHATKRALLSLLIGIKEEGKRIAAYGAAAKGNTLLNFCGIGADFIDFAVDKNPNKQGRFLPGTRIVVRAPEAIFDEKPDFVLILPWNIKDEIVQQMGAIRDWGGQFILPIPVPRVLLVRNNRQ
jgi:SAM-dependent methyltransferase